MSKSTNAKNDGMSHCLSKKTNARRPDHLHARTRSGPTGPRGALPATKFTNFHTLSDDPTSWRGNSGQCINSQEHRLMDEPPIEDFHRVRLITCLTSVIPFQIYFPRSTTAVGKDGKGSAPAGAARARLASLELDSHTNSRESSRTPSFLVEPSETKQHSRTIPYTSGTNLENLEQLNRIEIKMPSSKKKKTSLNT